MDFWIGTQYHAAAQENDLLHKITQQSARANVAIKRKLQKKALEQKRYSEYFNKKRKRKRKNDK